MTSGPALLARTPNGDAAFVRRQDGEVWYVSPQTTHESGESELDAAVAAGDFIEDLQTFDTWEALQRALDEAARRWLDERSWPGVESYSLHTVLEIVDDAVRAGGDNHVLAMTLLRDCPAAKDPAVHGRLLDLLHPPTVKVRSARPARNTAAYESVHRRLAA